MLAERVMKDLRFEYAITEREMDSVDAEARVRELLTTVYDDHVWEIADEHGLDFDDVVYDILDEVVSSVEG